MRRARWAATAVAAPVRKCSSPSPPEALPSAEGGGAAGATDAQATSLRKLLPAFKRHFWPFLKDSGRSRFLAASTLALWVHKALGTPFPAGLEQALLGERGSKERWAAIG